MAMYSQDRDRRTTAPEFAALLNSKPGNIAIGALVGAFLAMVGMLLAERNTYETAMKRGWIDIYGTTYKLVPAKLVPLPDQN